MRLLQRMMQLLGFRNERYPCRCGGRLRHVEYHSTQLCTSSALQFATVWDTPDPLPESEQWTRDELPVDG